MKDFKTADLCDDYSDYLQIPEPVFKSYGLKTKFYGQIVTLKCFEDNVIVKKTLGNDGKDKVLVVDAGGSKRCAMLGDILATLAINNNWNGVVIYGLIRDSADINKMDIGVKALGTHPLKSVKLDQGQKNLTVSFAGAKFKPDAYIYSDEDGIIVSDKKLL